jgi:hypothetical protein
MVAPSQTFSGMPPAASIIAAALPMRFVTSSQSSCGVSRISWNSSARTAGSARLSNTSARLAQKTRSRTPRAAARLFQRLGCFQVDSAVRRRSPSLPQVTPRRVVASASA